MAPITWLAIRMRFRLSDQCSVENRLTVLMRFINFNAIGIRQFSERKRLETDKVRTIVANGQASCFTDGIRIVQQQSNISFYVINPSKMGKIVRVCFCQTIGNHKGA